MRIRSPQAIAATVALCAALTLAAVTIAQASAARSSVGPQGAQASVVGGSPAQPGRFPFMAFIIAFRGDSGLACSGTVVSPSVILTAAHCAANTRTGVTNSPDGYFVVTGAVDVHSPEAQVSEVSRIVSFPHFTLLAPGNGYGDAALLQLATPTTAPPISIATRADDQRLRPGTHAFIAGWGETKFGSGPTPALLWARTVVEGIHCEGLRGRLCAIDFPKTTSGVCHGDSGGPLLAADRSGRGLLEIAITSAGFGKCTTRRPQLFQRTDLLSRWIKGRIHDLQKTAPSLPPPAQVAAP
jgi:secreted trypsin-like serine protease